MESQRKLPKMRWKDDNKFTSGKGKSQTCGHGKIPLTLSVVLQPVPKPVSKRGRHEILGTASL